jgi:hypothetical protein
MSFALGQQLMNKTTIQKITLNLWFDNNSGGGRYSEEAHRK